MRVRACASRGPEGLGEVAVGPPPEADLPDVFEKDDHQAVAEVGEDPAEWINVCVAAAYGLDAVVAK